MGERIFAIFVRAPGAQRVVGLRMIKWGILGRGRSVPHLERKLYHMAMGLGCFALYAFFLDRVEALIVLVVLGGAFVI